MRTRARLKWVVAAAVLLAVAERAPAELPPWVYKERQDKAPEALVIKVRSIGKRESTGEGWKDTHFTVTAEVQKVERTATSLKPGAVIEIRYTRRENSPPIVGPSEIPPLKEGEVYPAYLSVDGRKYAPAAGGYSFETIR